MENDGSTSCAAAARRQHQRMKTRDVVKLVYGGILVAKGAKAILEVLKKLKR